MQQGVLGGGRIPRTIRERNPFGTVYVPTHVPGGWIGQLAPSIILLSGQVEVHFVVLCRMIPIRSARKYIIAVGMHQAEGQRQCLSPSDESVFLEIGLP